MPFIIWTEFFSTGINYVDRQHQKLINIANEFHEHVINNANKSSLFSTLNKLIAYAEEHFRDEELVMEKANINSEHLERHKKLHEELTLSVFELNSELERGEKKTVQDIENFLNEWLIKHILEEDRKMLPFSANVRNYNPRA